jgi:hypothetical protein
VPDDGDAHRAPAWQPGAKQQVLAGANQTVRFRGAGGQTVALALGRPLLRALRSRRGGVLLVDAHARDAAGATAARIARLRFRGATRK